MARTPQQDDVFLREVDEAVRKDRVATATRRFGPAIGGALLLALAGYGGWLWYESDRGQRAGATGELYVQALDRVDGGNPPAAKATLAQISGGEVDGYATAAKMIEANVALDANDRAAAIAAWDTVAKDADAPQALRDLALIRKTAAEFDTINPDAVIARLRGLAVKDSPWFGAAGELTALAWLKKGDRARAGRLFAEISAAQNIAPTLTSRSVQMAGMLGVDAVVDAARTPPTRSPSPAPAP